MADDYGLGKHIARIRAVAKTAESCAAHITETSIRHNIRELSKLRIAALLIKNANKSLEGHPEYGVYEPLRTHLLKNLEDVRHVEVSEGLTVEKVLDEEVAGTYGDLHTARYRPTTVDPGLRSRMWRHGIWKPYFEGGAGFEGRTESEYSAKGKRGPRIIAYYPEVIESRLSKWGEKAPYWYFLEHGNSEGGDMYGGEPYPEFGGRPFVGPTRSEAQSIIESVTTEYLFDLEEQLRRIIIVDGLEFGKGTAVTTKVVDLGGGWNEYQRTSKLGKPFIQYRAPDQKWRSHEQMLAER